EVAQAAFYGQFDAAVRFRRIYGAETVGAGDEHEILVAAVVGHGARHAQFADHLVHRDERLAADVSAALGQHLVFDVRRRHAGIDVKLGGALHVEDVAVAAIHVHDERRNIEVPRRGSLFRIAYRLGELEFAQCAHRAAGGIGNFGAGIKIHVS